MSAVTKPIILDETGARIADALESIAGGGVIDDTAGSGDTDKTWSADKLTGELAEKYEKPVSGIPASDLASGVIPTVPVQDVQVNGTSVVSGGIATVPVATDEQVAEAVTDWLSTNIPTGETVVVDSSLTVSGAAADSKTTGDEITALSSAIDAKADSAVVNDLLDVDTIYSKNLNKTPYPASYTTKGVTFTRNSDGSISMANAPTGDIYWPSTDSQYKWLLPAGTYTLSGGRSKMSVDLLLYTNKTDSSSAMSKSSGNTSVTFTTNQDYWAWVRFTILSSASPDGITLYPQLEAGSQATSYQDPNYIEYKSSVLDDIEESISGYDAEISELSENVDSIMKFEVGKNLVNPSTKTTGGLQSNGSIDTSGAWASYATSDFIELETDTDYTFAVFNNSVTTPVNTARVIALLYDETETPIANSYQNISTGGVLNIDSGSTAKYVRVCSTASYKFQLEKGNSYTDYEAYSGKTVAMLPLGSAPMNQAQTGNVLWQKKWAVCGDSFTDGATDTKITDGGRYDGFGYVYPYLIGSRNDMEIVKFFNGGETLAFPADPGTFTNSLTYPSGTRYYQNIPADTDYITIYLGINDANHASGSSQDGEETTGYIPIGEITDNTTASYYGAWNVVLTWLITNRPNAHIGIIVTNGNSNDDYRQAQIAIAKKYGIAYIDLNGDSRTPAMLRTSNPDIASAVKTALLEKWRVSSSNTHPNDAAHLYESFFIENFLRSI